MPNPMLWWSRVLYFFQLVLLVVRLKRCSVASFTCPRIEIWDSTKFPNSISKCNICACKPNSGMLKWSALTHWRSKEGYKQTTISLRRLICLVLLLFLLSIFPSFSSSVPSTHLMLSGDFSFQQNLLFLKLFSLLLSLLLSSFFFWLHLKSQTEISSLWEPKMCHLNKL